MKNFKINIITTNSKLSLPSNIVNLDSLKYFSFWSIQRL